MKCQERRNCINSEIKYKSKYKNVGVLPIYGIQGLTFRANAFVREQRNSTKSLQSKQSAYRQYTNIFIFRFVFQHCKSNTNNLLQLDEK